MMRNEILETGQIVLLYTNGSWYGKSSGAGTLIKQLSCGSYGENWLVVLPDGDETTWGMDDTSKEINEDAIPF